VLVSCGAKHSIANLFQVLLDPGDEVVIPAPYWLSYPEMAKLAEAVPVVVEAPIARGFKPDPEALRRAITPKTRLLVLTSPSNPTGAVFTAAELRAIADVVKDFPRVYVLSDEIYDRLTYGGVRAPSFAAVAPELRERTLIVNGVSKTYAMTGLRIGWAVGPREVIDAATRLQSHQTSGPCSLAQAGAAAALESGNDALKGYLEALERRRRILIEGVAKIPGFVMVPPDGAFYGFPSIERLLGKRLLGREIRTAYDLAQGLLEHAGVVLVPGEPFGAPHAVRIAFALADAEIARGLAKIAAALEGAA
jgi:aspartate aminotransferase